MQTPQLYTVLPLIYDEFGISIPKARKLLITAGVYGTEKLRTVANLFAQEKTADEIAQFIRLSWSSANSYLSYQNLSYNLIQMFLPRRGQQKISGVEKSSR